MGQEIALGNIGLGAGGPGIGGSEGVSIIHFDTFTDVPGTLLTAHMPEIGKAYANIGGDFDIDTDHASSKTLPAGFAHVWTDPGKRTRNLWCYWRNSNDFAKLRTTIRTLNTNNYVFVEPHTFGNTYELIKRVGGVNTGLDAAAPVMANLTWYQLWIDIRGNLIQVYHEAFGNPKPAVPILEATDGDLAGETGVGMLGLNTDQWWDSLTVWG